jgi:PAS domain S-box-containing protein
MSLLPPILLLDDGADDRELVQLVLRGAFGEVTIEEVTDAAGLARAVSAGRFGAVLTEHELSWIRSRDLLRLIHDLRPDCPVIVVTGQPIERVAGELLHLAPDGLIPKTATGYAGLPRALRAALLASRRRAAAEAGEAPARRLLDALPAGVFVASEDGTLLDANPALARILGFAAPEDCVQRAFDSLFAAPAEGESLRARLAAGEGPIELDVRLRRADGAVISARVAAWRSGGDGVAASRFQGMVDDRSAAAAADAVLAERSAALARSTSELQEMAYVVSHDLRQPITQVARILDSLAQESGASLGAEAHALVDQARRSNQRLDAMVEAVLGCARIESRGQAFAPVDLEALFARVVQRLEPERVAVGAEIGHDPLPTVHGDESQLEQVVQNLLDNALKFRAPAGSRPPRVHLAATDEGEAWHFRMRDNGIGIAAQDLDRVFVIFQRLHTADESPGTGIGLAVCRRVVARHGGRIWVESRPGAGSTFHFTLAKRSAAAAGGGRRD